MTAMRAAYLVLALTTLVSCSDASKADASKAAAPPSDDMVQIPRGRFVRGRADGPRADEAPPHEVEVGAFSIDRTLVTRAAFERFVEATGYVSTAERDGYGIAAAEGMDDWAWERVAHGSWRRPFVSETDDARAFLRPDAPVVMVSWDDAVAFCAHVKKRLPTEAEWEYAMRAGAKGTRYPWGDAPERDGVMALNFWQGASHHENARTDGHVYVSPVRAFAPNAWGIHDPVGNVWQWTADFYAPDAYARAVAAGPVVSPRGPAEGTTRVLRGGSWWCGACTCEGNGLDYRGKGDPRAAFNNNGFRCARDG